MYLHSKMLLNDMYLSVSLDASLTFSGTSIFFCILSMRLFLKLSQCTTLISTVGLIYSGGPDHLNTSSLYNKYMGLDFPSIAESIPYDAISVIKFASLVIFVTFPHNTVLSTIKKIITVHFRPRINTF